MTVTPGYFELSDEQRRCVDFLKRWPSLLPYRNFDKRECDIPALEKSMGTMSHGERIVTNFFLDVWLHDSAGHFNFFDAMATLDQNTLQIIKDWMNDPLWP